MPAPVFLGDELSATGWRLAGLQVCTPAPGDEAAALAQACASAPLVLVSAAIGARVPAPALQAALQVLSPLVLVLPELQGPRATADAALRWHKQLGLAS